MHEVGITKDLVDSLNKQLQDKVEVVQVKKVTLRLGRALAIAEDSLRFWFNHFSQGTKLQDAELVVATVDGKALIVDSLEVN